MPASPIASSPGGIGALPTASSLPAAGGGTTAAGTEHVIKPNDRIADLAKKYHVTEAAILEANPSAKPKSLKVGDKLTIPPPAPAATAAAGSPSGGAAPATDGATTPAVTTAGESYLVKQGDTLARIAKKFGISVKQLKSANNLKSDRIVPKQKLTIPAKAPSASAAGSAPARTGGSI
jgi:LysM repeat protein